MVVVSNIFLMFYPEHWGKWSKFDAHIFKNWVGKNHQLEKWKIVLGVFRKIVFVVYFLAQKWLWYVLAVLKGEDVFLCVCVCR